MCVYKNITAKQPPRPPTVKRDEQRTAVLPPGPSPPVTNTRPAPFAASEALPFGLPREAPESPRPRKRPWTDQDGAALPRLAESANSGNNTTKQLCTLECIIRLGDSARSDPNCHNFSKHRRPDSGIAENAVHKLDMTALSSCGLLRDEDVPKGQLGQENIISEYEIVSRESVPIFRAVLPFGFTVVGKGVVRSDHSISPVAEGSKGPGSATPTEADILVRLGSQLAGECIPFCPGLIKPGKGLRDPDYAGPIQGVLLLASANAPLSNHIVPRHRMEVEIRRTVRDIRDRGVMLREPVVDADLRWDRDAQRLWS